MCGELPWTYKGFAAADTYHAPDGLDYIGSVVFASGWHCEDEAVDRRGGS